MKNYVLVEGGKVTNRTTFEGDKPDDWNVDQNWIASETAAIGWTYENGQFVEPVRPPDPPLALPELAPYQFRAMLKLSGKEAALDAFIAALPEPSKTIASAKLEYSLSFHRDNDLVLAAQQALGLTKDQLDALWTQAAAIK